MNLRLPLLLLLIFTGFFSAQSADYTVAPVPNWVKATPNVTVDPSHLKNIRSGYYFESTEDQINLTNNTVFTRYSINIINRNGVQEASNLEITFSPSYQQLVIHYIKIISKDNSERDALKTTQPNIIQREADKERFEYNGIKSAVFLLAGVKEGDRIEYAYSLKGFNPVFNNKYINAIYFKAYSPITRIYNRLICPSNRKLQFKEFNNPPKPTTTQEGSNNVYEWLATNVTEAIHEDYTPAWFNPLPHVQISEYKDWKEVADWGLSTFNIQKAKESSAVTDICKKIFVKSLTLEDSIWAAIHYVQDDIRYLGIEVGENTHRPNMPEKVINRGYGDCKDKALLLTAILDKIKVDATPALVSSYQSDNLRHLLPSPFAFNHVIVVFIYKDREYRVDATISNQGGGLHNIYCPNYGGALILTPQTDKLKFFPLCNSGWIKLTERYTLTQNKDSAELEVYSRYYGREAEIMRATIESSSRVELFKTYLDYYTKLYPDIIDLDKSRIEDSRKSNSLTVIEKYLIPTFWDKTNNKENVLYRNFYPAEIGQKIPLPEIRNRKSPIANYNHPTTYYQNIEIITKDKWEIPLENFEEQTSAYKVTVKRGVNGKTIKLYYTYQSQSDYIPAEQTKEYVTQSKALIEKLEYQLVWNKHLDSAYGFNWILLLATLLFVAIAAWILIQVNKRDIITPFAGNQPWQIDSWLYLLAIGIYISPFVLMYSIYQSGFFNNYAMETLTQEDSSLYNPLAAWIISIECLANMLLLVVSIYVAYLFYYQRTLFPVFFIINRILYILIPVLDVIVTNKYLGLNNEIVDTDVVRNIMIAAIWIPIIVIADRVKHTFTVISEETAERYPNLSKDDEEPPPQPHTPPTPPPTPPAY